MKIVEDSPTRLVMKESAIGSRIAAGIFVILGVGVVAAGFTQHKNKIFIILFGLIFTVVGILLLLFSKSDTITADKTSRQLTILFKSLTNKNGQSQTVSFDDVLSVQIFQQYRQRMVNNMNNGMNEGTGLSFGNGGVGLGGNNMQTEIEINLMIQLKNGTMITVANESHQASMGIGISSNSLIRKTANWQLQSVSNFSSREQNHSARY